MDQDGPLLPEGMLFDQPARVRVRKKRRRFKRLRKIYVRVVPARIRKWIDDNPALAAIVGLLLLLLLIILIWLLWLWLHLHKAPGFNADLGDNRPPFLGGENILLVGLDCDEAAPAGDKLRTCNDNDGNIDLTKLTGSGFSDLGNGPSGTSPSVDPEDPTGSKAFEATGVRSDVIMVLHVAEDGRHAQVISIPRDSYVDIDGHGKSKINAAFSWGGPNLLGRTIEQDFKIHLTHIVVTDFDGFRGITDALGGVQVYVPEDVVDERCNCVSWHKGWQTIKGETALDYVRTRHGLARGDFDRVQRHQNFLRAVVQRTRSMDVLVNPVKLTKLVDAATSHVAMDKDMSDTEVMKLTYAGLKMSLGDMSFATVPFEGAAMVGDQSVVLLKMKDAVALFNAMQRDKFLSYVGDHDVEQLPPENAVK